MVELRKQVKSQWPLRIAQPTPILDGT